jgi:thymidylate synthase (FAD)
MHVVTPKVFYIGRTETNPVAIRAWLDHIGADQYQIDQNATGSELLVQLAAKRCYMSFQAGLNPNVTRVRTDMADFIENILKVGHGSVLAHASHSFAIEGVSRVFTGEMNRHAAGTAISEGSMRYIRFDDIPWVKTPILNLENYEHGSPEYQKVLATIDLFNHAFTQMQDNYQAFCGIWQEELADSSTFKAKKTLTSLGRRMIGMGCGTGGVWTGNLRALRHIFAMRCDEAAEEEILLVASMMLEKMRAAEPLFFGDFELIDGYWKPKYWKV